MTWEEFTNAKKQWIPGMFGDDWMYSITEIECPDCGELLYRNDSVVLSCWPPAHQYKCMKCNWIGSA